MALTASQPLTRGEVPGAVGSLLAHEARQLYHLATALESAVGESDARPVIERALTRLGEWRADKMTSEPLRRLSEVIANWNDATLLALVEGGWGNVLVSDNDARFEIVSSPDLMLLRQRGREDLYMLQWRPLLERIGQKIGQNAGIPHRGAGSWDRDQTALVATVAQCGGAGPGDFHPVELSWDGLEEKLTHTVKNRAAQFYFFAVEAISSYDATGEAAVREGTRRFARERGETLRDQHVASGLPLNLQTMMSDFDYGGEGVWKFNDGDLSPHAWSQDCTYCPFAEMWREFDDGLQIGYIYDLEFHVAEFQAYNPRIRVMWEKLQTRGDSVCSFRFTQQPQNG